MRAMRAEKFSGYEGLKLVDLPKPAVSEGKVLLRMTAAGVTPPGPYDSVRPIPPRNERAAASPRQRRSGRGGGGRRNRLSRRFTCDVHRAVWRF